VRLIESIPVANLIRNVHHWAAHVMIASIVLHLLRVFFTGTYRRPRELTWLLGVVLLIVTLAAGFVGYGLPWDAFAVTATGIGYGLARSVPLGGQLLAELVFGGTFPSLGSLPRLYTLHVVVLPATIAAVLAGHLLLVFHLKHSQPGYARRLAGSDRVLGISLWPSHAVLAGVLLFLLLGGLSLLGGFVPVHPLAAYGPPTPATPAVKPDWYLLWIFGMLKLIPAGVGFRLGPLVVGPEFLGGVLVPGLVLGTLALVPWLDRSNRGPLGRFEYLEPLQQAPRRLALGIGMLSWLGVLLVAAEADLSGLSPAQQWLLVLAVPGLVSAGVYGWLRRRGARPGDSTVSGGDVGDAGQVDAVGVD
jgi:cytochrome b-561